jgi:hypothetical protein
MISPTLLVFIVGDDRRLLLVLMVGVEGCSYVLIREKYFNVVGKDERKRL